MRADNTCFILLSPKLKLQSFEAIAKSKRPNHMPWALLTLSQWDNLDQACRHSKLPFMHPSNNSLSKLYRKSQHKSHCHSVVKVDLYAVLPILSLSAVAGLIGFVSPILVSPSYDNSQSVAIVNSSVWLRVNVLIEIWDPFVHFWLHDGFWTSLNLPSCSFPLTLYSGRCVYMIGCVLCPSNLSWLWHYHIIEWCTIKSCLQVSNWYHGGQIPTPSHVAGDQAFPSLHPSRSVY